MVQHGWTAHAKDALRPIERGNRTSLPSMGVPTLRTLAVALLLATLASSAGFAERGTSSASRSPNIVFIVADDFSWNLVRFMPHVKRMQKDGVSLARYYVTDSLCCPSRASIFTGKFPHNTGIFTNGGRAGGWPLFHSRGLEKDTFATRLQAAGYSTAFMGKYMNGYAPSRFVDGEPAYTGSKGNAYDSA
jgi:N-acetylglucosamine-6-sulfatase